ncbi:hypothetical protein JX580_04640 [Thiomicrospira microaerophila]|uniref:zinc ribbon-containing protein n=1 Tax=Thiomicrospira microaerophila TaxID=406020 RepID=UPI0020103C77|nr:zinc ribbon-containing protein [Thiomicrospira microaerophila]UQB43169.1 hypothetical protein JX580_04640 [Thiomicrospira microaerophila]
MTLSDKLQNAYNALMDSLSFKIKAAEDKSLHWLGEEIVNIEQKGQALEVLTERELEQVQTLLQKDIEMAAEYFNEVGEGLDAFIENDWPAIEAILSEKALSVADPTQIQYLKLRLQAAMG